MRGPRAFGVCEVRGARCCCVYNLWEVSHVVPSSFFWSLVCVVDIFLHHHYHPSSSTFVVVGIIHPAEYNPPHPFAFLFLFYTAACSRISIQETHCCIMTPRYLFDHLNSTLYYSRVTGMRAAVFRPFLCDAHVPRDIVSTTIITITITITTSIGVRRCCRCSMLNLGFRPSFSPFSLSISFCSLLASVLHGDVCGPQYPDFFTQLKLSLLSTLFFFAL
ncbi:hypothetical protein BDN70DRAFT_26671 [Pholiota conissans]|uniref:Uncharacterized protein n=1 Tax=Pholiota conissans TaxID=109636 RepID=A0A9P5ZC21_9AGAR|nr:hypothetical protein BDN70DRAFT_26671 [Pholiota conissans]